MGLLGGGSDPDDEVEAIIVAAESDTVTRQILTDPKPGMVTHNLGHAPILDFVDEDEQPHYVLLNTSKGVSVTEGSGTEQLKPKGSRRAFAVVTDQRLLFLVGADGVETHQVALDDVAAYEIRRGRMKNRLLVRGAGTVTDFPVSKSNLGDSETDALRDFLDRRTDGAGDEWTDEDTEKARVAATSNDDSRPADANSSGTVDPADGGSARAADDVVETATDESEDDDLVSKVEVNHGPTVRVYPDRILIEKEGGALQSETSKEFLMEGLTGVEFMEAGRMKPGWLYFSRQGGDDADGPLDKWHSDDSVQFRGEQNDEFKELHETIRRLRREWRSSDDQDGSGGQEQGSPVETLKQRFAAGELSKEEYEERLELLEE